MIKLPTELYTLLVANAPLALEVERRSADSLADLSQLSGPNPAD